VDGGVKRLQTAKEDAGMQETRYLLARLLLMSLVIFASQALALAAEEQGDRVAVIHDQAEGFQVVTREEGGLSYLIITNQPAVIFSRLPGDPQFTQGIATGPEPGQLTLTVGLGEDTHMMGCVTKKAYLDDRYTWTCQGSIGVCVECEVKPKPEPKDLGTIFVSATP